MKESTLYCKGVNELLAQDARLYSNLGCDSTLSERRAVKAESRRIYNEIKKHDKLLGDELLLTLK